MNYTELNKLKSFLSEDKEGTNLDHRINRKNLLSELENLLIEQEPVPLNESLAASASKCPA